MPSEYSRHCYKIAVTLDCNNETTEYEVYGYNYNHALSRNGFNNVINTGFSGKVELLETLY